MGQRGSRDRRGHNDGDPPMRKSEVYFVFGLLFYLIAIAALLALVFS